MYCEHGNINFGYIKLHEIILASEKAHFKFSYKADKINVRHAIVVNKTKTKLNFHSHILIPEPEV